MHCTNGILIQRQVNTDIYFIFNPISIGVCHLRHSTRGGGGIYPHPKSSLKPCLGGGGGGGDGGRGTGAWIKIIIS